MKRVRKNLFNKNNPNLNQSDVLEVEKIFESNKDVKMKDKRINHSKKNHESMRRPVSSNSRVAPHIKDK